MSGVSNAALAVLVLSVLVVLSISVVMNLQRAPRFYADPTGYASSDTGYVNLTINSTLAIQVDSTNSSIIFGACVPQAAVSYWCASNDSSACSGTPANGNCSGDNTTAQFIRVDNIGSIDANVTVQSACNASTFIGGTNPLFEYITTACNGTGVSTWNNFSSSVNTDACTNLSYIGGMLRLYANITIPNNAVGGSGACANQSTITFTAVQAG